MNSSIIGLDDEFAEWLLHLVGMSFLVNMCDNEGRFVLSGCLQHFQLCDGVHALIGLDNFKNQRLNDHSEYIRGTSFHLRSEWK